MNDNKQLTPTSQQQEQQRAVLPAVDVFEDESGITVLADMPGVSKNELELKVEGDTLSIEGGVERSTRPAPGCEQAATGEGSRARCNDACLASTGSGARHGQPESRPSESSTVAPDCARAKGA